MIKNESKKADNIKITFNAGIYLSFFFLLSLSVGCKRPKEDIVLRQIKDVVVDASTDQC
jgi:hypothetical protein